MILVGVARPVKKKLKVKAVVVENEDGTGDRFIWGDDLHNLVIEHPEVLTQLGG